MRVAEPQSMPPEIEGRRQIRRVLYIVRWIIIAGILLEAQLHFGSAHVLRLPIMVSAGSVAVLTAIVALVEDRTQRLRSPLLAVAVDIAMVGVIVLFSDGIQSPFYALFYVTLIEAAVAFGARGALLCAGVITVLSFIDEVADTRQVWTEARILEDFVRTVPYLFIIAATTGALRDRIAVLASAAATLQTRQEGVERELAVARDVQRAQLPASVPEIEGARIMVLYAPAREVGGDLYDFYPVGDHTIGVAVADAAGKGVPAAILVANARYAIRQYASEDKATMMRRVNEHVVTDTSEDAFVALLQGTLDIARREFRFANAGQMPPIVVSGRDGTTKACEAYGLPLGVMPSAEYSEQRLGLEPGDTLVLYTDGITDAIGLGGDGLEGFRAFLEKLSHRDFSTWRDELLAAIENPMRADDVTVVAIRLDDECGAPEEACPTPIRVSG